MLEKPKDMTQVWTEREICEKLDLPIKKTGRSQQISNWVSGGLKCAELSGRRFFFEDDILDFLYVKSKNGDETSYEA